MSTTNELESVTDAIVRRARERYARHLDRTHASTDRLFGKMLLGQWLAAVVLAILYSPYAWEGRARAVHAHVWLAIGLGGVIVSLPTALTFLRPGWIATRHVVAIGQMLLGALLIHLSGGRIETHFHVFGSLAFLAFYMDWPVLITGAAVVAADHFLRGLLWPESIYGIASAEWWRFLEHAFWVVFCSAFLIVGCRRQSREWLAFAEEGGMIEALAESERLDRSAAPSSVQAD